MIIHQIEVKRLTLKEARKEARDRARIYGYCYLSISKQTEIGWYTEHNATQRTVFFVHKDGSLELHNSDLARNYHRQYLSNIKLRKQQ